MHDNKHVRMSRRWWEYLLSPSVIVVVVQLALFAVYLFGDIGFDHRGRFGLDFNAYVVLGISYIIVLPFGLMCSISERNWITGILQILIPLAVISYENRPYPSYDPTAFQHLKGKSRSEVEAVLGTRYLGCGIYGHPEGDRECVYYGEMEIIYSSQGRVISVRSHD